MLFLCGWLSPPPNNFIQKSLLKNRNDFFFYITTSIFYKKFISNAILDHLGAWIFKIAPRTKPWLALSVTLNFSPPPENKNGSHGTETI